MYFYNSRGKGDFYRLGHGCDSHHREPKLVEGLVGKKIVDVAVGVLHCLAVTEHGEVRKFSFLYLIFGLFIVTSITVKKKML